jgi:hypothetical protein
VNKVAAVAPGKAGLDTEVLEARVVEVTENRVGRGFLHGEIVMRALPARCSSSWQPAQTCVPTNCGLGAGRRRAGNEQCPRAVAGSAAAAAQAPARRKAENRKSGMRDDSAPRLTPAGYGQRSGRLRRLAALRTRGSAPMKIGILKTDAVREEWAPTYGEYPDMFARCSAAATPELEFSVYDVRHGRVSP